MRRWSVKALLVASAALASSGCLVFTSISDLGGQTRPTDDLGDGGVASDGAATTDSAGPDGAASDARREATFGASFVIAQTAPGLRGLDVSGTQVFFANEDTGQLRAVAKTTAPGAAGEGTIIVPGAIKPTDLVVDATRVYWIQTEDTTGAANAYRSVKHDGSDPQAAGGDFSTSRRMVREGFHILTITFDASSNLSLRRDGQRLVEFGRNGTSKSLTSDGTTVYYERGGTIARFPEVDGGPAFAIADPVDMAVDERAVYWITGSGLLQKLDKSAGGTPVDLATGLSAATRLAVYEDDVYVTAWGTGTTTGRVVRVPKAGGAAVDLATGLSGPWGLAVDASGVYVASYGDGTVRAIPRL